MAGCADLLWFERGEGAVGDVPGELVAEGCGEAGEVQRAALRLCSSTTGAVVQEPYPVVPCEDVVHAASPWSLSG